MDTWLVVADARQVQVPWLVEQLQRLLQPFALAVRATSQWELLTSVQWRLHVATRMTACALAAPHWSLAAGSSQRDDEPLPGAERDTRLAGILHCGLHVTLPEQVQDASYKSAEWNALLTAWLHSAPCPVINRPRCDGSLAFPASTAVWRQRAARAGLPIWPSAAVESVPTCAPGLLVCGRQVFEAVHPFDAAPQWPAGLHDAAALAAAAAGSDWLAWTGTRDGNGLWRVKDATTFPDLRFFGEPALRSLAALMRRHGTRAGQHLHNARTA